VCNTLDARIRRTQPTQSSNDGEGLQRRSSTIDAMLTSTRQMRRSLQGAAHLNAGPGSVLLPLNSSLLCRSRHGDQHQFNGLRSLRNANASHQWCVHAMCSVAGPPQHCGAASGPRVCNSIATTMRKQATRFAAHQHSGRAQNP
jgi:hypothetical protein